MCIVGCLPAQVECSNAVAVGHLERRPHPRPEFVASIFTQRELTEIEIRQRPARFELVIDGVGFLKPAFRLVGVAAQLGGQTQSDSWCGRARIKPGTISSQKRRRILAGCIRLVMQVPPDIPPLSGSCSIARPSPAGVR